MAITHEQLTVEEGALPVTVAHAGGIGAAVLIVPSGFGVAADVEAQMEEIAREASVVVALDLFFRGDGGPISYDDFPRVRTRLQGLDRERGYRDTKLALEWLRAREGVNGIVILGVCFGGGYALRAAADGLVDGVVTWHGGQMHKLVDRAGAMRCPMRLHFGSADPAVAPADLEAIRAAFVGRDDVKIFVHDGAVHGFSHRAAASYDAGAERAGMASVVELVNAPAAS